MVKYGKVLQTACKTGSRRGPWVHRGICRVQEWFNPIPWRLVDRTPKQCNGHLAGKLRYRIIWMENIEHPATGLIGTHTAHRKLHQRSSILCPHSLLAIEHQALENTSAKSSKSPQSPPVVVVSSFWALTWMHAAPSGKGGCSGTSGPCETRGVSPAAQVCLGLGHTQRGTHCKKASRHRMFVGSMPSQKRSQSVQKKVYPDQRN